MLILSMSTGPRMPSLRNWISLRPNIRNCSFWGACRAILLSTLEALATAFPSVNSIPSQSEFTKAVELCQGLDGRRIRKLVATACTFDKETALDPNRLSTKDLMRAAEHAQKEAKAAQRKHL